MFEWFTEFMESPLGKLISTGILAVAVLLLTLAAAGLVNRLMKKLVDRHRKTNSSIATVLGFVRYIAVAAVYFAGGMVIVGAIPVLSSAVRTLLATGGVIAVVAGLAAQEALGSVVSGYLTRLYVRWFGCTRVNSVIASSVTGAFLMISLALVAITRDPYITIILISIGGFGHQIISCMLSALVVESFDKGQMATVNGMRGSAAWIASFLFSLLIGVTADKIGFNPLFIAMGFFDLIGAVFLVAFIAERRAKRA